MDVNQTDSSGLSPLSLAVEKGNLEIAKILISEKANPNVSGINGGKLLTTSMSKGYDAISKELIKAGATEVSLLAFPSDVESKGIEFNNLLSHEPTLIMNGDSQNNTEITFNLAGKAKLLSFNFSNGHDGKVGWFDPAYNTKFKITGDGKDLFTSDWFGISDNRNSSGSTDFCL